MIKRVLGIDVGISSIGWSLLEFPGDTDSTNLPKGRIIASGVRIFTQAENPNGESLAKPRRDARLARRRNRRRAQRLARIKDLFFKYRLITGIPREKANSIYKTEEDKKSPWTLRKNALYRELQGEEFARILTHIAKRRGFKSMRRTETEGSDAKAKENQRVLTEIAKNKAALTAGKWQTVGEMIVSTQGRNSYRNKSGSYSNSISRDLLQEEVRIIFEKQRKMNSAFATPELEIEFTEIAFKQNPIQSMLKMVGNCAFEKGEKRAPKNSYSAELFTALTKTNNLVLKPKAANAEDRELTKDEREKAIQLCHSNAKVTYKQLRKEIGLPETWIFNTLNYSQKPQKARKALKEPESSTFFEMKGYHAIRKSVGETLWDNLKNDKAALNTIAAVVATEKADETIILALKEHGIPEDITGKVLSLNFSQFLHLSLKALDRIIPYMQAGCKYTEACEKAGYNPLRPHMAAKKQMLLRPLNDEENDQITNPVAKRAIAQFRKVVNAIIREHGKFDTMNIELARDLSNSFEKRREIEAGQKEFQVEKERAAKRCEEAGIAPNSKNNLLKFRLWEEQDGFCPYCGEKLEIEKLAQYGYAEVDHIIPWSRSLDDSRHNKVLAHIHDNQQKKNQIPFEYLGGDGPKWNEYVGRLDTMFKNLAKPKRNRLLKRKFDDKDMEGFKERNLNDTRYISRFIKNFVENNLEFAESAHKQKVAVRSGSLTAFLRHQWGLTKKRDENDRHHALDAIVVACATQGMVKFAADVAQKQESYDWTNKMRPRFDQPWQNFREDALESVGKVFVSRAPRHKVTGAAHKETISSKKHIKEGYSVLKTPLTKITTKDLENLFDRQNNERLYETLKERLSQFGNDSQKAFGDPENPVRMPCKIVGKGPIIRSVKIKSVQKSGTPVRHGIAENGDMPRVDVFEKKGRYYLVPVYVADFKKRDLPQRAIKAAKPEQEWDLIYKTYNFKFSLYKDDLVRVNTTGKPEDEILGYFVKCHRGTGALSIDAVDRLKHWDGVGAKTLKKFEKYTVSVLGKPTQVHSETRVGVIRKNGVAHNTGNKAM